MTADERAISTVVDVALALLLVSAAVATMVLFLDSDGPEPETRSPDELAQTLSATTFGVNYSIAGVQDEPHFHDGSYFDYDRRTHGTAVTLAARAAVDGVRFPVASGDGRVNPVASGYRRAVRGGVADRITGAGESARVVAVWRPYNRSDIEGRLVAGGTPPADADVSSTTLHVPSRFDEITAAEIRAAKADGGERAVAELIAGTIVDGYFPPTETQLALEQRGIAGALAHYRYERFRNVTRRATGVDWDYDRPFTKRVISREAADVEAANRELTARIADLIEAELDRYEDLDPDRLAAAVSTGHVVVVVQTW